MGICFMSDRQKRVMEGVIKHFPMTSKRFCARHIYANFKQKWSGMLLKMLFLRAANSTNEEDFKSAMYEIGLYNKDPYGYKRLVPL